MEKSLEYYLNMSVAELKNVKFKKKILFSEERYLFTHFCQYATQEQVEALLDDTGISLLDRAPEKHLKINGLLTSGKEFPFFENEEFCKIVIENNGMDFVYNIDENAAVDFSKYLCKYDRKGVLKLFNITNSACQLEVLKNGDWSKEEILDFFEKVGKKLLNIC